VINIAANTVHLEGRWIPAAWVAASIVVAGLVVVELGRPRIAREPRVSSDGRVDHDEDDDSGLSNTGRIQPEMRTQEARPSVGALRHVRSMATFAPPRMPVSLVSIGSHLPGLLLIALLFGSFNSAHGIKLALMVASMCLVMYIWAVLLAAPSIGLYSEFGCLPLGGVRLVVTVAALIVAIADKEFTRSPWSHGHIPIVAWCLTILMIALAGYGAGSWQVRLRANLRARAYPRWSGDRLESSFMRQLEALPNARFFRLDGDPVSYRRERPSQSTCAGIAVVAGRRVALIGWTFWRSGLYEVRTKPHPFALYRDGEYCQEENQDIKRLSSDVNRVAMRYLSPSVKGFLLISTTRVPGIAGDIEIEGHLPKWIEPVTSEAALCQIVDYLRPAANSVSHRTLVAVAEFGGYVRPG
jgi:hypothetical protein